MYNSLFLRPISHFMLACAYNKYTVDTYITWVKSYIHYTPVNNNRAMQQSLAHADVKIKELDTHVLKQGAQGLNSFLSKLLSVY